MHQYESGSITAPVYFRIDQFCFPEKGWSDFVVVVLSWWLEAVSMLTTGQEECVELHFMDGPMLVRASITDAENVGLEFIERGLSDEVVENTVTLQLTCLAEQLQKVTNRVLTSCRQKGWQTEDVRILQQTLAQVS